MQVTTEDNYNQGSTWQNQFREVLGDCTSGKVNNNIDYHSATTLYLSPL